MVLDPYSQTPMFKKMKKSMKFINKIKEDGVVLEPQFKKVKSTTERSIKVDKKFKVKPKLEVSLNTTSLDIFDQVNKINNTEDEDTKMKFIPEVSLYLKSLLESKLESSLKETKANSLFTTIAKSMTSKIVEKDDFLFGKDQEVTGLYILVYGKIGLSKEPEATWKNSTNK